LSANGKNRIIHKNYLVVDQIPLGAFGANSYLITCPANQESVLIDAPGEPEVLKKFLDKTKPVSLVLTHGHFDHLGAVNQIREFSQVPTGIHPEDRGFLDFTPDFELYHGQVIPAGKLKLEVLHTPGHTPGSICLKVDNCLISGDTIFPGGPGKTSSPEDFKKILNSIRKTISNMPDNTLILPGHGHHTDLKTEREKFNRFEELGFTPGLYGDVTWT